MTLTELSLIAGFIGNCLALIFAVIKLTSWISTHIALSNEKILNLERQVNNDVTGRKVVGEMREDLAAIKAQVFDLKEDIRLLHTLNKER